MTIVVFLGAVLLLYCIWCVTIRKGLKTLSCTRAFSKPAVFEGEEGELVEVVRNDRAIIIPWLLVESKISPHLQLGRQDNLHVSGQMYYCSQFTLLPHQQIRRRHRVRFLHRGAYNLGNASLTAGDNLGFTHFQRTQKLDAPVLVYPRLLGDEDLPIPTSQLLGELSRRPQLLQDPFLVRGLRSYYPGDPVRDIHWPATARTGEVQLRIHDYSARSKLLVVLNTQYMEQQWNDLLPEEITEEMEYAISLAASVCIRALRSGLSVGFATNMPLDDSRESTVLPPAESAGREEVLLSAFARLRVLRTQHFPSFLEELPVCSDLDILILSRYESDTIRRCMLDLERRGNRVLFQLLEGGSR